MSEVNTLASQRYLHAKWYDLHHGSVWYRVCLCLPTVDAELHHIKTVRELDLAAFRLTPSMMIYESEAVYESLDYNAH